MDSPEVSIPFASFACCTFTRTPPFSQDGCKQRAKHVCFFIKFQDSKSRKASISVRAYSPSTKPFYPPTIRHSRSQKLMADSLRCRSPSFIAINPFSLPAKIYSGHFLHFYFFSNTRIHHMLCSLTASHSLPTPSPTLPSPFKRHQTTVGWFCRCGKCAKRRQICQTQTL